MALPEFALKAGREQYSWEMYPQVPRGVVPWGAGGAMAPPDFGRPVNPILTGGGGTDYAHQIITGTPGFSDLPMALMCSS